MATKKVSEKIQNVFKLEFLEFGYYSDNFYLSSTQLIALGR